MARVKRLVRKEIDIPSLGRCLLEVKEDGIILHIRGNSTRHSWSWEYLFDVCQCPNCADEGNVVSFL